MLIIVAVHPDGDVLSQRRLPLAAETFLDKFDYGCGQRHTSHLINRIDLEVGLDFDKMPSTLKHFVEKHKNAEFFALDSVFHDDAKDFDYTGWYNRAYPSGKSGECRRND